MKHQMRRLLIVIVASVGFALGLAAAPVSAGVEGEGFTLGASSAYCEPGYFGPFVDCTPWEGLTVTFTTSDGSFSESCTTATAERAAGCTVVVPFGSTITASIDPASIPAGYVLEKEASQEIQIPDGPPEGEFGGAAFVLFAEDAGDDNGADDGDDNGAGSDDGDTDGGDTGEGGDAGADEDTGDVSGLPVTGAGAADGPAAPASVVSALVALTLALGAIGSRLLRTGIVRR